MKNKTETKTKMKVENASRLKISQCPQRKVGGAKGNEGIFKRHVKC